MLACLRGRCTSTRKNSQIDKALNNSKSSDSSVSKRGLHTIVSYIKDNDDKKRYCVNHGAAKVIVDAVKKHEELASSGCLALYYMVKIGPEGVDACMKAGAALMATETIMNNMRHVNACINASNLIRKLAQSNDHNKQIIKDMTFGQYGQFSITLVVMFAKMFHEGREATTDEEKEDKDYVLDRLKALSDVLYDDEEEVDEEEVDEEEVYEDEGEDPRKHPNGNPEGPNEGGGRRRRNRATQKKKKTKRRNTRKGLKYV